MIYIAHRGNTNGKFESYENEPNYIDMAIKKGFDAEIDIWCIDNLYIVGNELHQYGDRGISDIYQKVTYYKINPYDLERMNYTSPEDLEVFRMNYMSSLNIKDFETKRLTYNNLAIEHLTKNMEEMIEEIDELSAFFEDKKQAINILTTINDKYIMNNDILTFIIDKYLY